LGGTAPARLTGAVGSIEPDDRGVERRRRAVSQATARGVAPDGASWRGTYYRPGFVLIIDSAERFACGKQIASYVGLIPCEDSEMALSSESRE